MSLHKSKPFQMGILVLIVLAAGGYYYWANFMRGHVTTDDARLAGTMVDFSAEIPGRLTKFPVATGEHIEAGDLLFELDARDQHAALDAAKSSLPIARAGVKAAEANLAKARRGPRRQQINAARTRVDRLKTQLELARSQQARSTRLHDQQAISEQAFDKANSHVDVLKKSIEEARQHLDMLTAGTRPEDIDAAEAKLEQANSRVAASQAKLNQAKLALAHTVKRASFDGIVVRTWPDTGEQVRPGSPVVTVLDPTTLHVDANIEETDLGAIQVGDQVDVDIDAYPDAQMHGQIDVIKDTTKSQFSMTPSEGVSGAFIKVTQRVPLRIELTDTPDASDYLMAPGLSVVLDIHTDSGSPAGSGGR